MALLEQRAYFWLYWSRGIAFGFIGVEGFLCDLLEQRAYFWLYWSIGLTSGFFGAEFTFGLRAEFTLYSFKQMVYFRLYGSKVFTFDLLVQNVYFVIYFNTGYCDRCCIM